MFSSIFLVDKPWENSRHTKNHKNAKNLKMPQSVNPNTPRRC